MREQMHSKWATDSCPTIRSTLYENDCRHDFKPCMISHYRLIVPSADNKDWRTGEVEVAESSRMKRMSERVKKGERKMSFELRRPDVPPTELVTL